MAEFTTKRNADSSEQLDVFARGVKVGALSSITGEYVLTVCPTCLCKVAESCGRLGVCSHMECGADFSEQLAALFVEGVDEPA